MVASVAGLCLVLWLRPTMITSVLPFGLAFLFRSATNITAGTIFRGITAQIATISKVTLSIELDRPKGGQSKHEKTKRRPLHLLTRILMSFGVGRIRSLRFSYF